MYLNGIHHVTAVSADITNNVYFYTRMMGLRLVKKSVNQDDTSAYHLFYGDKLGTPGTDMTFFDWPNIGQNIPGTDRIAGTAFRVPSREALDFWFERFQKYDVNKGEILDFAGRELLPFEDPEGQQLYLVNDQGTVFEGELWEHPEIPNKYALRGFFSVVLSVPSLTRLEGLFRQVLNFQLISQAIWIDKKSIVTIFSTTKTGGPGTEIWLVEEPDQNRSRLGAGGTHHLAFRVNDFETQEKWQDHISKHDLSISPLIDRFWFRSIYFRVTPGILFEIATDGPGFAIDEELDNLGEKLVLPPFLEDRRQEIEAGLIPIPG